MSIVIVGAGPAGLISALYLIREGESPIVLEKNPGIRSKACGEACGLESLAEIPFDSSDYISRQLKGAQIIYADGRSVSLNKRCVTLDRERWLEGMAREVEARGGHIRLNSEVVSVGEHSVQLKSGETLDYEVLVGADGPNSRIARHLGISHRFVTASQYKLARDTSGIDYLQLHVDKRFSPSYSWIFPKEGVVNVGLEGNFAHLDAFLAHRGLNADHVVERRAGILPISGIKKLVQHNIALIGDAGGMANPFSGNGLTPIIYAAQMLARYVHDLPGYELKIVAHPMADPVLAEARGALQNLTGNQMASVLGFVIATRSARIKSVGKIIQHPSLLPRLRMLKRVDRALTISMRYGW